MTRQAGELAVELEALGRQDPAVVPRERSRHELLAELAEDAAIEAKRYVTTWEVRGGGE